MHWFWLIGTICILLFRASDYLRRWAEETTMHGPSHALLSSTDYGRVFWYILICVSACLCIPQLYMLIGVAFDPVGHHLTYTVGNKRICQNYRFEPFCFMFFQNIDMVSLSWQLYWMQIIAFELYQFEIRVIYYLLWITYCRMRMCK